MRELEVLEDRDHLGRATGPATIAQRHDPPARGDRDEEHALGIDGEGARAAELLGVHVNAEAGGHGDLGPLGRADAQQREHRADAPSCDPYPLGAAYGRAGSVASCLM